MIIYPNQIKAAEEVRKHFDNFYSPFNYNRFEFLSINGKLQSGKTGCLVQTCRLIFPEEVVALTTYADKALVSQFDNDFANEFNVSTVKISTAMKQLETNQQLITDIQNASALIIDEGEYRLDLESQLSMFIQAIMTKFPKKRLMIIFSGATNFSYNYLKHMFRFPAHSVELEAGDGYTGITNFYDSPNFNHIERVGPVKVTDEILDSLKDTLSQHTTGLYMLRIPTTANDADEVAGDLAKIFNNQIQSDSLTIKSIHSKDGKEIKDELRAATKLSMKKNVIIIVCGALQAGFRFVDVIKQNIRFVYETYSKSASAIQGLIGRSCGYHDNIPVIWADRRVFEEYIKLYNDEEKYIPGENASTHLGSKISTTDFVPCELHSEYKIVDRKEIENLLGIVRDDYRYSETSKVLEKQGEFLRQWNESFKDEPNYDSITWTSRNQEMRPYHILVNTDEGVSRVMKKTGDKETRTTIDKTTSTSFLSDDKYINKEK